MRTRWYSTGSPLSRGTSGWCQSDQPITPGDGDIRCPLRCDGRSPKTHKALRVPGVACARRQIPVNRYEEIPQYAPATGNAEDLQRCGHDIEIMLYVCTE